MDKGPGIIWHGLQLLGPNVLVRSVPGSYVDAPTAVCAKGTNLSSQFRMSPCSSMRSCIWKSDYTILHADWRASSRTLASIKPAFLLLHIRLAHACDGLLPVLAYGAMRWIVFSSSFTSDQELSWCYVVDHFIVVQCSSSTPTFSHATDCEV